MFPSNPSCVLALLAVSSFGNFLVFVDGKCKIEPVDGHVNWPSKKKKIKRNAFKNRTDFWTKDLSCRYRFGNSFGTFDNKINRNNNNDNLLVIPDAKEYNQDMHQVAPDLMQRAGATEQVTVSYCESPLLMDKLGPEIGLSMQVFHASVVFHLPNTNTNSSIELNAHDFNSVFLPTLNRSAESLPVIDWHNGASINPKEGTVDFTYWLRKKELGKISGKRYNALLDWLATPETKTRFAKYALFQLQDEAFTKNKNLSVQTTLVPSTTCFDFVGAALEQLELEGSRLEGWRSRNWIYDIVKNGTPVKIVEAADLAVREQLWQYYNNVTLAFNEVMSSNPTTNYMIAKQQAYTQVMAHGEAFVYSGDKYYQFTTTSPYIEFDYL